MAGCSWRMDCWALRFHNGDKAALGTFEFDLATKELRLSKTRNSPARAYQSQPANARDDWFAKGSNWVIAELIRNWKSRKASIDSWKAFTWTLAAQRINLIDGIK